MSFLEMQHERPDYSLPDDVVARRDKARTQRRIENSNVPARYRSWGWGNLDPYRHDADGRVQEWVARFIDGKIVEQTGRGLLLYGKPGHGKTSLSAVALLEVLRGSTPRSWGDSWSKPHQPSRAAYMAPYRHFPKLTQRQFNNATTPEEDNLLLDIVGDRSPDTAVRLLVLDDVGKEHRTASGWAVSFFEDLIRERSYEGWPTIITTNLYPDQWKATYGDSCESFFHEAFDHLLIESPVGDRRKQ